MRIIRPVSGDSASGNGTKAKQARAVVLAWRSGVEWNDPESPESGILAAEVCEFASEGQVLLLRT